LGCCVVVRQKNDENRAMEESNENVDEENVDDEE